MCRNIRRLRRQDRPPTDEEIKEAALQFVRKISGYRHPSRTNEQAFDQAVAEISAASRSLFDKLTIR